MRHSLLVSVAIALAFSGAGCTRIDQASQAGAGTAAHNLCSSTFVSGLPIEQTEKELVGTLVGPARHLLNYRIDPTLKTVEATLLLAHAKAIYQPGYGCRLVYGSATTQAWQAVPPQSPSVESFAPESRVESQDPQLIAALEREFADESDHPRRVKAIVIVKDGRVIAERYAAGFDVDTPINSFSVAKSVTNAFLGILVRQGRFSMDAPAPVPEWQASGDPRAKIRPTDLLQMASGLDAAEDDSGSDPASQMLYASDDMAGYSASRPLAKPPAAAWEYTSVDTLLLDRMMGTIVGGPPEFRRFAETELFAPLGMKNVTIEFDGAGTFVGSSHVYMPARSFARLGLLYLNDGVAPDGRRLLPEGWVAYSRKSTLGTSYGAGFWTNDGSDSYSAYRVAQGFPKDGFFASGNLGQRIYIIPSERLVVARFGYSQGPDFGIEEDLRLIRTTIEATKN